MEKAFLRLLWKFDSKISLNLYRINSNGTVDKIATMEKKVSGATREAP